MSRQLAIILALSAAVLWGTTGTTQSFAPDNTNPIAFGAMRLFIGGLTLFMIVVLQKKQIRNMPYKLVFLAAFSMACYQPLFFSAVKLTGVAVGTVVGIGSAPILAGFIEWLMLKKKPQNTWFIATCFAIAGCLLLFQSDSPLVMNPYGMLLAIGAGLSFSIYTIVSKQLIVGNDATTVTAVVFSLSALLLLPVLFVVDMAWLFTFRGIATTMYLGVFATGVAYLLFSKGLTRLPSSTAVTLTLAEPLTATILGAFVVGESLSLNAWIGVSFLLFSIIILSYSPKRSIQMKHTSVS